MAKLHNPDDQRRYSRGAQKVSEQFMRNQVDKGVDSRVPAGRGTDHSDYNQHAPYMVASVEDQGIQADELRRVHTEGLQRTSKNRFMWAPDDCTVTKHP